MYDTCFGGTRQIVYVLVLEYNVVGFGGANTYCVLVFNGTVIVGKQYMGTVNATANAVVDFFRFDAGRLLVGFPTLIQVYTVTNTTTLTRSHQFSYSLTPTEYLDGKL